MNFVDKVEVNIISGKGGDGHRSFRHERFIAKGGPDGGDGGDGGDVVLQASNNQNTLSSFRYQKKLKAEDGQPGGKSRKHGKRGQDLVIKVPVGTQVIDSSGVVIADLIKDDQQEVIAYGGKGGFGNAHFVSSTRQAPDFAEKGEPSQNLSLFLELKLIADAGLVGMPNAGKSTLLSRISNARPEIADYPFTTLKPNLGVVEVDKDFSCLIADIPGLIEGASSGKGLGYEFLRHIERTKLVIHLIDAYSDDVVKTYKGIRKELAAYSEYLSQLPEIIVLNKIDGLSRTDQKERINRLKKAAPKTVKVMGISALSGENLDDLKYLVKDTLISIQKEQAQAETDEPDLPVISITNKEGQWSVEKTDSGYIVRGPKIEQFAVRTDPNNPEAVARLLNIIRRMGIYHELNRRGKSDDDLVYFGDNPTAFKL